MPPLQSDLATQSSTATPIRHGNPNSTRIKSCREILVGCDLHEQHEAAGARSVISSELELEGDETSSSL
ncbi:unnamed protein product [Linum trigynum]|uniref:Uncharacterized protein n=1 Tax=Linum trigynum TaxID=586398 RepID=A0AAV2GQU0_9ROSI